MGCPHECITSHVMGNTFEFIDAINQCKEHDESHMWLVRSDGSYIQIESYYDRGTCISVDYERGDGESMLARTCHKGKLVLKDCSSEYGTEWYFTEGQLINSLCWGAGLSSVMAVFLEDRDDTNSVVRECKKDVTVWGANLEALLKMDTYMFLNRVPEALFHIEDVEDALDATFLSTVSQLFDNVFQNITPLPILSFCLIHPHLSLCSYDEKLHHRNLELLLTVI